MTAGVDRWGASSATNRMIPEECQVGTSTMVKKLEQRASHSLRMFAVVRYSTLGCEDGVSSYSADRCFHVLFGGWLLLEGDAVRVTQSGRTYKLNSKLTYIERLHTTQNPDSGSLRQKRRGTSTQYFCTTGVV